MRQRSQFARTQNCLRQRDFVLPWIADLQGLRTSLPDWRRQSSATRICHQGLGSPPSQKRSKFHIVGCRLSPPSHHAPSSPRRRDTASPTCGRFQCPHYSPLQGRATMPQLFLDHCGAAPHAGGALGGRGLPVVAVALDCWVSDGRVRPSTGSVPTAFDAASIHGQEPWCRYSVGLGHLRRPCRVN